MLSSAVKTILSYGTPSGELLRAGSNDIPDVVTSSLDNVEKEWILRMSRRQMKQHITNA